MIDVLILSILVGLDMLLTLYCRYKDSINPPLTSREFHFFRYDDMEKIKEILHESDEKRRIERWEEFQRLRKDIKSDSNINGKSNDDSHG